MKLPVLIILSIFAAGAAFGSVAPACTAGTYQSYINLGSNGCVIGGMTFSSFASLTVIESGTLPPLTSNNFIVTPTVSGNDVTFTFSYETSSGPVPITLSAGQNLALQISYYVAAAPGVITTLQQTSNDSTTGKGSVSGSTNVLGTGSSTVFTSAVNNGAAPKTTNVITGPITAITSPSPFFLVTSNDILSASSGTINQWSFSNVYDPSPGTLLLTPFDDIVPEPMTFAWVGFGLICIALTRRRKS